ncbi:hypothetical protein K9N68_24060 [Kovacikia minuta CCNUW1]|uniref:hypothetical protein n=1 Tax=Kovacikia minuta TaxID=2931930 RepID=UPI001CCE56C5|nr:hypothetical protein [Kovacikia minuta]UBF24719.1 hypothetical protein K9N68_24060 [Kovacikia minuta CCNUW1]
MSILHKRLTLLSAIATLSVFAVSCSESKVAQCNKVSAVVNKAANETQAIGKSNNPDKMAELSKAADTVDQYAKELEAVQVTDEKLKGLQASFVKMYRDTSKSSRELVAAAKAKNVPTVKTSLQSLQTATSKETTLVNDFNQYCRGK